MEIAWFKKIRKPKQPVEHKRIQVPEGLWVKCNGCKEIIYKKEVLRNANVCPKCNYHFRISARERLSALFDDARYQEVDTDIYSVDSLKFRDVKSYKDRLREYREKTGLNDAIINARGTIGSLQIMMAVMEYGFMGGSMGSAVGEKVTRAIERALEERIPLVVISCSGGARMQEGALSLMQMAKISAALGCLTFTYTAEALSVPPSSAPPAPASNLGQAGAPHAAAAGSGSAASGTAGRGREPLPFPTPMVARTKITPSPEVS